MALHLPLPAPSTAVSLSGSTLAAGAEDGTVRIYVLPEIKVTKAIRGLGNEVSSVAFAPGSPVFLWLAAGQHIFSYDLSTEKMILSRVDAKVEKQVLTDEGDVLNEIAVNKTHVAFTCDTGGVGVLDIATQTVSFLKPRHENVAHPISFIPNRPREVVSGGYDCSLQHSDYLLGTYLSSFSFSGPSSALSATTTAPSTTSMSPPFCHCLRISFEGLIAAGLGDGRVWIGSGGVKDPSGKKGRSKKWEGLDPEHGRFLEVATGPIVALAFQNAQSLSVVSLGGTVNTISLPEGEELWHSTVSQIVKVNSCDYAGGFLAVAGVTKENRGSVEIWLPETTNTTTANSVTNAL